MRFEIIERHIIDVPDSELTDGERPLGKMALVEVLDVIAENPHRSSSGTRCTARR